VTPLATWAVLAVAIVCEVVGTSLLHASAQFTRVGPTLGMAACYLAAFYLLSLAMQLLPMGVVYAVWSGLGIVLVSAVGLVAFGQRLDAPALIGIGLILAGVVAINLSGTAPH
jgi:small multidrug resistance pump